MAGIYLHIPFCRTRCVYCDFYSTTLPAKKDSYLEALCQELHLRKDYLKRESLKTIYIGGGTPSQLSGRDLFKLIDTIDNVYGLGEVKEITLEANPDDLTPTYLNEISALPINRLSIGIQTFNDHILRLLNRRHTSVQALKAIENARANGFNNISIDLMYGLPGETIDIWKKDLQLAMSLEVEHLSAYHLTYEDGTPIYNMLEKQQVKEVDEEDSILFFTTLIDCLSETGYEHYEISNFCRHGKYSMHNTSYWNGVTYMGCGASAHSYDGSSREWNADNIDLYIQDIKKGIHAVETEYLDTNTRYNDLIVTSLRTKWGVSIERLKKDFGEMYIDYCLKMATKYLNNGDLDMKDDHLLLSPRGIFISDAIMRDLLYITE